jgi:archaellum biogenesis ATPase FlaH
MKPIQELTQLLLNKEFYEANKHRINRRMFEDSDYEQIYKSILRAHEKSDSDVTLQDVSALYEIDNPSVPRAKKENVRILLRELANRPTLSPAVAEEVLQGAWRQDVGRDIMQLGNDILVGRTQDLAAVKKLVERTKDDFIPDLGIVPCTNDVYELMAMSSEEKRWEFNIRALREKIPGVMGGELLIIFARPETGKTAAHVSFCYGPSGFAEQGAKIATFVNEEPSKRTQWRVLSSFVGITKEEIQEDVKFTAQEFLPIKDNCNLFDAHETSIEKLDAFCEIHKPDIVVVDQLDKISINGSFSRTDERLREIYKQARDIAVRHNVAFIAVSQASADAMGKTRLDPSEMEGSKTGKFAEADIIIGIGKHDMSGIDEEPDMTRHLTVGKNKVTGWHGTVICEIQPQLSRYVD